MVLGIIGALMGLIPLFFLVAGILGVLAIVFGIIGISRAKRGIATNKIMSWFGLLLGVIAVILMFVGIAIIDDAFNGESDDAPGRHQNPVDIVEGQPFEVDGFSYSGGWSVTEDYGMVGIEGLSVTNNRGENDSLFATVKFWSGSTVLAELTCHSGDIAPGTTIADVDCGGLDELPNGYDRMTIEDSF
ncbi:MAG: DUF4190 domain-containing protein [Aeromicrobium sp.]|uniref:DUF4190 domain-containing protein n=1 Tax=Aeromicrobium sp. TaxID=1871063 RepID=UPI0039E4BACD